MTVYGADLSNHDWDRAHAAGRAGVDLADMRKAGISFATHKVTEGCPAAGEYVDPFFDDFARQLQAMRDPFPVAGSYHATHRDHAREQADFWFDTVTAKYSSWRAHPCWLWQIDAEPLDGYAAPTKADVLAIGARLEARGVDPNLIVLYGPRWVYANGLDGVPYRLWASGYGSNPVTAFKRAYPGDNSPAWAPYSGRAPLILQFGSRTRIGAQATCDANAIRVGSEAALVSLLSGSPDPTRTSDLMEEIMALPGAPKDYKTFLADIQNAVDNPAWQSAADGKRHSPDTLIRVIANEKFKVYLGPVAAVVNDSAKRVAALQAAVAALPGAQVAVDVAAVASATADAVTAKLKGLIWKVQD